MLSDYTVAFIALYMTNMCMHETRLCTVLCFTFLPFFGAAKHPADKIDVFNFVYMTDKKTSQSDYNY